MIQTGRPSWRSLLFVVFCGLAAGPVFSQPKSGMKSRPFIPSPREQAGPRLEAVAETRLLMEGLNQANFRGLERLLGTKPTEEEAWKFARGQALLIAETGNLLMLRPPKNEGEGPWMDHSGALRTSAANLAQLLAKHDYDRSKAGLYNLANTCNRCHQTFRTPVKIAPFVEPADRSDAQNRS